ncbi:MAG: D-2-hydroxyacid dehydrogenase [bacterium]
MPGPIRVLIDIHSANYDLWDFPEPLYQVFLEKFPSVMFHRCTSLEDFRAHLDAATVIFGRWLRPEELPLATQLTWFHTSAAGVERQLYPAFVERGITLTSSAGARAGAIAEFIMGSLIAFNRQLPRIWSAQRERRWDATTSWVNYQRIPVLDGGRMVIAGLGGIGQETARLAKAFGMEVWGTKRDITTEIPWVDRIAPPEALAELLPGADVVVDCLPSTPATHQLFSAELFALMESSTVFINVGRGATVDEMALTAALETQQIRGAILDVFTTEPLSVDSALWTLDSCMVVPHVSNIVDQFWEPTADLFYENLRLFLLNLPLMNVVEQTGAGY